MIINIMEINRDEILNSTQQMFDEGYRFITITCVDQDNAFDLLYHFGKDFEMKHLRVNLSKEEDIESISSIYFCSLLVENEIKDLFGVKIKNIAIDYNGKLLLSEGASYAPMCNISQIDIEVRGNKDGR